VNACNPNTQETEAGTCHYIARPYLKKKKKKRRPNMFSGLLYFKHVPVMICATLYCNCMFIFPCHEAKLCEKRYCSLLITLSQEPSNRPNTEQSSKETQ
jgi:hypothetical protein